MRKAIVAAALVGTIFGGLALPSAAQDGIVIQNNGVDSTNSAAGADNVRISRAAGTSSTVNGAGMNNEVGVAVNEKKRERKERAARNTTGGGDEVPAETVNAAPAEGDYQAFTEAAPEAAPQEMAAAPGDAALDPNLPVQLPNTGVGAAAGMPLGAIAAALAAGLGAMGMRRRRRN